MLLLDTELSFQCPGETGAISASVHRARLASGYHKCQTCSHNNTKNAGKVTSFDDPTKLIQEGHRIRGVYLRPLTPKTVLSALAEPLYSLWHQTVRTVSSDARSPRQSLYRPSIAVSCDLRHPSLEIYRQLLSGLELTGCHIVELGPLPEAQFCFGIQHYNVTAGIYITGNDHGPANSGFNLYSEHGLPWTLPAFDSQSTRTRLTRTAASLRQERITLAYETHIRKYFHGLRPLRVLVGVTDEIMKGTVDRLFEKLPCVMLSQVIPPRAHESWPALTSLVPEHHCDGGLLIDEDAGRVQLIDELGRPASSPSLLQLASRALRQEQPASLLSVAESFATPTLLEQGVVLAKPTLSAATRDMYEQRSGLALLEEGRLWHFDQHPRCDALVTLAWVLKSLSLADTPLSELVS